MNLMLEHDQALIGDGKRSIIEYAIMFMARLNDVHAAIDGIDRCFCDTVERDEFVECVMIQHLNPGMICQSVFFAITISLLIIVTNVCRIGLQQH